MEFIETHSDGRRRHGRIASVDNTLQLKSFEKHNRNAKIKNERHDVG
jgi:hypothetical protein